MAEQDVKPDVSAAEYVNLKVVSADGQEIHFKIKRKTPMKKLIAAYVERQGLLASSVRFIFDGKTIDQNSAHTPDELGMEDNDIIEVSQTQVGGGAGARLYWNS